MQGNLLFVGCSHTNGFWGGRNKEGTLDKVTWDTNNYAEIYAEELADSQCYIYSSAGACNSKYPRWIRHMLNTHKDISGVVMQSTYWDRWVMSADMKQHHRELDPGFFTKIEKTNDKVICYDDYNVDKDWHLVEWFEKIKWESIGNYTEGCPEFNGGYEWIGFDTNYMHMKFHTEVATHLKTEEYQKDIALIDAITNVPVYVWRINDKVQYPEKFDTYKNLDNVRVFDEPADSWLLKNLNIDIKDMMLDEEHYNEEAHRLIAQHFIPEVLNGTA
jgi:hypothetical protein